MPSPYKEIPITFEKGLVTEIEESLLDIGQASDLENWEPLPNGALRTRNRYSSISVDGLTAPYNVRGFGSIATGGSAAGTGGPQVVQTSRWPDGANTDAVNTKTGTLTGVTIGHVLVAVVTDDSNETPTVSGGWTQRAISTGNEQWVKFYTKTAASSTEAFTYTIVAKRIRSLTVYELANVDSEDPGSAWAADAINTTPGGSSTLTVNTIDDEGGIAISGYLYNGGTPATTGSGSSGFAGSTLDDSNSRTGIQIEDLDQLDMVSSDSAADLVTPSWTPPETGVLLCVVTLWAATAASLTSVSGNGLSWSAPATLSGFGGTINVNYSWADLSLVTPTSGSITVDISMNGARAALVSFFRIIGGSTSAPVLDSASGSIANGGGAGPDVGTLASASGLLGGFIQASASGNGNCTPVASAADFDSAVPLDSLSVFSPSSGVTAYVRYAKNENPTTSQSHPDWSNSSGTSVTAWVMELAGNGGAAQARHGTYSTLGEVIEGFDYVANKAITAKIVTWSADPAPVANDAVEFYITIAMAETATKYSIYRILRDEITTGTWELIDSIDDAGDSDAWVSFAQGAGQLVWTSTTLTAPRAIALASLTASNITDLAGLAGRTAAYHKDRMFIGGASDYPSRLFFSDIGLPTDFTTVTDYLDIGGDDGEAIQSLVSVEGLLLVPKTNRAYLVSGSGIESFFVNELAGGTAASGRVAERTPYGTILAGVDDIWVIQGGGVDPMSRPLGGGYVITGNASVAYAQDSVLIADSGTNQVWRVNLVTGAWSTESVTGDDAPVYIVFALNGRIYYGTNEGDTQVGGTRKLTDARTYDQTTGGTQFRGATGRVALLGPSVKYTPRWLFLQTRSHDTDMPNILWVEIESDHGVTTQDVTVRQSTQRDRIDVPKLHSGSEWLKITFRAASSATAGAIDPERTVLGVDVEAPR